MFFEDGSSKQCEHIGVDRFALWKHFRSIHQGRYLYYCDVEGCDHGADEKNGNTKNTNWINIINSLKRMIL